VSIALSLCLLVILTLAAIGTPVAYSILVGSIVYLAVKGQDIGIAGEQMISGLYDSFVLLAVPLFIVAANIMNA
jgi:TRAP-type transport system large permease protein